MAEQPIIIIKKKVHGGHAHHGGSWKVAYADFVTAMMAFFMVMWIMGLSDQTRAQIQGYFNDPLGFTKNEPKSKSIMTLPGNPSSKPGMSRKIGDHDPYKDEQKALEKEAKQVQQMLAGAHDFKDLLKDVRVTVTPDGLLIELLETKGAVFFNSGSSEIRPEAKVLIDRIAHILALSKRKMNIQGHTDAQAYNGSVNGNWGLSTERALSLQQELTKGGVGQDQFGEVAGYAATRLLNPAKPLDFSNRRVTILLPREYHPGDTVDTPKDALSSAIAAGSQPEAVEVGPPVPQISGKPHK